MDERPERTYRRFFQFRLSTWLVLVGIVAWAMATRPYVTHREIEHFYYYDAHKKVPPGVEYIEGRPGEYFVGWHTGDPLKVLGQPNRVWGLVRQRWTINPRLRWPALALVAFIGWKTFWLIRERRRERAAHAVLE